MESEHFNNMLLNALYVNSKRQFDGQNVTTNTARAKTEG